MNLQPPINNIRGQRRRFSSRKEIAGLVSVIIPSYQSKWCVGEAIDSVLAQTYTFYEIIVVDDGSTDGSAEYLTDKYGSHIHLIRQNNQGLAAARNSGLDAATGEFIQFLDADDLLLPQKFEKQLAFLANHSEAGSVTCHVMDMDLTTGLVSETPRKVKVEDLFPALLWTNCIGSVHGLLTRSSIVKGIGGFDENFHNYCADWELWLTTAWLGYRFGLIPEALGYYRRHRNSLRKTFVYPNTIGDLHVVLRAREYAKVTGSEESWQVNNVLTMRHERSAYWAAKEIGIKKALDHVLQSLHYVPRKRKLTQLIRGIKIVIDARIMLGLENNPKYMRFAKKIQKVLKNWGLI